jgi:putative glycosyltransferase (TIGR04372 family)
MNYLWTLVQRKLIQKQIQYSFSKMLLFITKQLQQIRNGGKVVLYRKFIRALKVLLYSPLFLLFSPILILIRLIRPFFIIRFGGVVSSRIGHLAANTELYLCEKEAGINIPNKPYIDIFYLKYKPICNEFLVKKWSQILYIFPRWLIHPINILNNLIPFGKIHMIGDNLNHDRDIGNLLDRYQEHIKFTQEEELKGKEILKEMGIPLNSKIVCLLVRDSAYLNAHIPNSILDYHNYRDSNIENYLLASEYLADLGFFVIRMGRVVNKPFISNKAGILDYASSKWTSDFMDIYLGAKCTFCISTGAGWDAVPAWIFRKPTIFTNLVPIGYLPTFSDKFLLTTKRHYSQILKRELMVSEIFSHGLNNCLNSSSYSDKQIDLIENTPEEIKDVVIEMIEYLNFENDQNEAEKLISNRFWNLYSEMNDSFSSNIVLHGKLKSRFSTSYLIKNEQWVN